MILHRTRPKSKVAPVKRTVLLFDAGNPTRTPDFGRGILRGAPHHRAPASFADLAWAAAAFGHGPETVWDRETIDESRALEVEALDRLERGCIL